MRNQKITLQLVERTEDEYGGHTISYIEKQFFGKIAFAKDRMVVTKINDINTQRLVNMYKLYLLTTYNNIDDLRAIKRGDKLTLNGIVYTAYLVESYDKTYVITLLEDFQ